MNKYSQARTTAGRTDADAITRRQLITDLIAKERIGSQAELGRLIRGQGVRVTQATLSRDLKSLGIGKVPAREGAYVYVLPSAPTELLDGHRQRMEIEAFVQGVKAVKNLVLLHTPPGNATGVARAIDLMRWAEVEGTIAGDDTILIVTRTARRAEAFIKRVAELTGRRYS